VVVYRLDNAVAWSSLNLRTKNKGIPSRDYAKEGNSESDTSSDERDGL